MSKKSAAKAIANARTESPPLSIERMQLSDLVPDPRNARSHPEENKRAIRRSLLRFGQVEPLVVRKGTNVVVGGNGRLEEMRELGWEECDVVVRELSDHEASALGLALNRSGELATWNRENLSMLLPALPDDLGEVVGIRALAKHVKIPLLPDDIGGLMPGEGDFQIATAPVFQLNQAPMWPSSNEWGIPDLYPQGFVQPENAPTHTWRKKDAKEDTLPTEETTGGPVRFLYIQSFCAFDNMGGGTLGFYTDDKRFESVWSKPTEFALKLLSSGVQGTIETDFSQYGDQPWAVQLWNAYRNRFISRTFQGLGLRVIPSASWSGDPRTWGFTMGLLPKDAPVLSMQVRTTGDDDVARAIVIRKLEYILEELKPVKLLVYGGTLHRLWFERHLKGEYETEIVYLAPAWQEVG